MSADLPVLKERSNIDYDSALREKSLVLGYSFAGGAYIMTGTATKK